MRIDTRIHQINNKKYFPRRANLDIYVYKVLKVFWAGSEHGWKYQTCQVFMNIELNKTYYCPAFEKFTHNDDVWLGFFSFTSKRKAMEYVNRRNEPIAVFEAMIPKGSLYYEGKDGIMSDHIKVLKQYGK